MQIRQVRPQPCESGMALITCRSRLTYVSVWYLAEVALCSVLCFPTSEQQHKTKSLQKVLYCLPMLKVKSKLVYYYYELVVLVS